MFARAPPRRRRLALWSQQAHLQGDTSSKQRFSRSVAWRTRGQSRTSDSARTEWPFAHVGTRSPHGDPRGDVTRCEGNRRCCGPTASSSHPKSDRRRTLRSDCQSSTRRRIASALAWQPDEANKVPRQDRKGTVRFSRGGSARWQFLKALNDGGLARFCNARRSPPSPSGYGAAAFAFRATVRPPSPFGLRFAPAFAFRATVRPPSPFGLRCARLRLSGYGAPAFALRATARQPSPGLPSRSSRFGEVTRERRLVSREGIEPSTRRLRVCCSAN